MKRNPHYQFHSQDSTFFCTNHQGRALKEGGKWIESNRTRRWICSACLEAKSAAMKKVAA